MARKHCGNCNSVLQGEWCHDCGQRALNTQRSIFSLLGEFLRESFELDGRVPRSLTTLLRRPGLMTRAFMEGRRSRYTSPVRIYLSTSLVWLFVAWGVSFGEVWLGNNDDEPVYFYVTNEEHSIEDESEIDLSSPGSLTVQVNVTPPEHPHRSFEAIRPILLSLRTPFSTPEERQVFVQTEQWKRLESQFLENWNSAQGSQDMLSWLTDAIPKAFFLGLPLLGLLLWGLHGLKVRGGLLTAIIASLNLTSAVFVFYTLFLLSGLLPSSSYWVSILRSLILLAIPIHWFFALHRIWDAPLWKTILRHLVLVVFYSVALALLVAFSLIVAALSG